VVKKSKKTVAEIKTEMVGNVQSIMQSIADNFDTLSKEDYNKLYYITSTLHNTVSNYQNLKDREKNMSNYKQNMATRVQGFLGGSQSDS
jgi:hypothetical protein